MDLNKFAREVAKIEGKKREVDIAQIKEILKIVLELLAEEPIEETLETLRKYRRMKNG